MFPLALFNMYILVDTILVHQEVPYFSHVLIIKKQLEKPAARSCNFISSFDLYLNRKPLKSTFCCVRSLIKQRSALTRKTEP